MAYLNPAAGFARQGLTSAGAPVAGTDEVQSVAVSGTPTGGTFRLLFDGQTTDALAYNATTAAMQTALRALGAIGATGVTVTGTPPNYVLTFGGPLGKRDVGQVQAVAVALTGGSNPAVATATTTPGVSASGRGAPKGSTLTRLDTGVLMINTGTDVAPTFVSVGAQT
jgi:hypothetical protein